MISIQATTQHTNGTRPEWPGWKREGMEGTGPAQHARHAVKRTARHSATTASAERRSSDSGWRGASWGHPGRHRTFRTKTSRTAWQNLFRALATIRIAKNCRMAIPNLHGKSHFNRNIHVGVLFMKFFFVIECHNYDQIAQGIQKFSKIWSSWLITKDIHVLYGFWQKCTTSQFIWNVGFMWDIFHSMILCGIHVG